MAELGYCVCDKEARAPETLRCAKWQVELDARCSAEDTRRRIGMHTRSRAVRYFSRTAKTCADCGKKVYTILICYTTATRLGSVQRAFPGGVISPVAAAPAAVYRRSAARRRARGAGGARQAAVSGGGSAAAGGAPPGGAVAEPSDDSSDPPDSDEEPEAADSCAGDSDASPAETEGSSSGLDEESGEPGDDLPTGATGPYRPRSAATTAAAAEAILAKLRVAAAVVEQARLLAGNGLLANKLSFIGGAIEQVAEQAESMRTVVAALRAAQRSVERARAVSSGSFLSAELAAACTIMQLAIDAAGPTAGAPA